MNLNLINFQGLNCYSNCIVTIAAFLGVDYIRAFSSLWSETDFRYDSFRRVFLTRRMPAGLEALGARLDMRLLDRSTPEEAEARLDAVESETLLLVGMDGYYIPWVPLYGLLHGPHYFIAVNTASSELKGFDPTYTLFNQPIPRESLHTHAFDISYLCRVPASPFLEESTPALQEAREILLTHPQLLQNLTAQIRSCADGGHEQAILLAEYVDALISNRYLYRRYLQEQELCEACPLFFRKEFFAQWTAVKNGLYKMSASRDTHIHDDVCMLLTGLLEQESALAAKLAAE